MFYENSMYFSLFLLASRETFIISFVSLGLLCKVGEKTYFILISLDKCKTSNLINHFIFLTSEKKNELKKVVLDKLFDP